MEIKELPLSENVRNPFYGIVLPGICSRHEDKNILTESSLDSYKIYLANLKRLTSYLSKNNISNFFAVERNILNRINSGEKAELISPLDNTEFLLVYNNNLFPLAGYCAGALQGLYKRVGDKFVEISDITENTKDWSDISTQGISPNFSNEKETVNWMFNTGINYELERLTIRRLAEEVKDKGHDEVRIAGERLWDIGVLI